MGHRILNLDAITHASYDPLVSHPGCSDTWKECAVSFGNEDTQIFYNDEAEALWLLLSHHARRPQFEFQQLRHETRSQSA
jgi:hypothetical protein